VLPIELLIEHQKFNWIFLLKFQYAINVAYKGIAFLINFSNPYTFATFSNPYTFATFSNPYTFATFWRKTLIFQTWIILSNN